MTLEEVGRFIDLSSDASVPSDIVDAVHSRYIRISIGTHYQDVTSLQL